MRIKIIFAYDGTNFYGLQKQPNLRSVESSFEEVLFGINNNSITKFVSSGRTDRGVHAKGQVAHFDISVEITMDKLKRALNSYLPEDIHVIFCEEVANDFHARFSVKEKTYTYLINCGELSVFDRSHVYQYGRGLDIEEMNKAIKSFLGTHNFVNFVSKQDKRDDYKRTITKANISKEGDHIKIIFSSNGFMKYQVRNMVGTLLRIGQGKLPAESIAQMLNGDDTIKAYTIKPEGLYLSEVKY